MNVQIGIDFGILIAMLINFAIIFFVIRKFATKPIVEALQKRKALIEKLENADKTYQDIIDKAEVEQQAILKEAKNKKEAIVAEAQAIAAQKGQEIIAQSQKNAEDIIEQAQENADRLVEGFEKNFENGVKETTEIVVKKLLGNKAQLEEDYVNSLIKEAKK